MEVEGFLFNEWLVASFHAKTAGQGGMDLLTVVLPLVYLMKFMTD